MPEFTIGEVSVHSKVSASAIRYYDRQGLIAQPARIDEEIELVDRQLSQLARLRALLERAR